VKKLGNFHRALTTLYFILEPQTSNEVCMPGGAVALLNVIRRKEIEAIR
jgi:hypothetical protein